MAKDIGYSLNLSVTPGKKTSVYRDVAAKLTIKNIIPFFNRKVNLVCNLPSVFSSKKIAPCVINNETVVKPTRMA